MTIPWPEPCWQDQKLSLKWYAAGCHWLAAVCVVGYEVLVATVAYSSEKS